ncbi:MAG: hypothetical protein ACRD11_15890 [Terriglobia bacterium]
MTGGRSLLSIASICAFALGAGALTAPGQQASPASMAKPAASPQKEKTKAGRVNLKQISLSPVDPMALAQSIRPATGAKAAERTGGKVKSAASTSGAPSSAASTGSGVMEFRTVSAQPPPGHAALGFGAKSSKHPLLKDVHGEAYGARASVAQAEDAAVGASSKSGKTHIFIHADHNQNSSPR